MSLYVDMPIRVCVCVCIRQLLKQNMYLYVSLYMYVSICLQVCVPLLTCNLFHGTLLVEKMFLNKYSCHIGAFRKSVCDLKRNQSISRNFVSIFILKLWGE